MGKSKGQSKLWPRPELERLGSRRRRFFDFLRYRGVRSMRTGSQGRWSRRALLRAAFADPREWINILAVKPKATGLRTPRPRRRGPIAPARWPIVLVWAACAGAGAAENPSAHDQALDRLSSELRSILALPPGQQGLSAVHVLELDSGRELYADSQDRPLIPASNMKLVVMAAAIDRLGPDFKYQTVLGVRDEDLVVIGAGDPTTGDERLCGSRGERITEIFHGWARTLQNAGIRRIPGNIVIDDLIFDLKFTHPHWPDNQYQLWYEAPVGGLNFNSNCVAATVAPTGPGSPAKIQLLPENALFKLVNRTTTGSKNTVIVTRPRDADSLVLSGTVAKEGVLQEVTVRDPGLFYGSVFKSVLASEGIAVGGQVVRERIRLDNGLLPDNCHVIAVHRAPLADALARAGKDSLGMMAAALFKTMGALDQQRGSWESGRYAVQRFLREAGIPEDQVTVDDGSGLSRQNRLSARAITQVLRKVYDSPPEQFELLRQSLAVAGEDGTLKKRLRQEGVRGRVFGKTGYLNGVWALSGYVHTRADRWLAFALLYNATGKMQTPKPRMDRACQLLVKWPELPESGSR